MANEMFTRRDGKQIPVPTLTVTPSEVTSLMALQEDYEKRGEYLSLLGVLLDVIDKGKRQVKNQWKNGDISKDRREFSKAVTPFMRDPVKYAKEIQTLALRFNMITGQPVDLSDVPAEEPAAPDLTEEQLEKATAPSNGVPA
jgi:hypothetical protein